MANEPTLDELEMMAIGNKIRQLREEKGLNQEQLAELAGKSVNTIKNIESGKHEPDLKTLRAMAKALSVKVTSLLDEAHSASTQDLLEGMLETVREFDEEERKALVTVLEGLVLKHQAKKLFGGKV